jgi:PHD/YefM family antitoxin component YafN of YafNO toxin-antitoxin module
MRTLTAKELDTDVTRLAAEAAREPVAVISDAQERLVVMSEERYRRLTGEAWSDLFAAMDRLGREAQARGLTEEKLEELLADES